MNFLYKTLLAATIGITALAITTSNSSANTKTAVVNGNNYANPYSGQSLSSQFYNRNDSDIAILNLRHLNSFQYTKFGSSTARHFYKVGIRNFDKGNFDKAEKAFEAVLRANGLNTEAYYYLTLINLEKGNNVEALKYSNAFYSSGEK